MAEIPSEKNLNMFVARGRSGAGTSIVVHPAWERLIRYCADLRHGEIDKLKIQDGLPMAAEITTRKVKFIGE